MEWILKIWYLLQIILGVTILFFVFCTFTTSMIFKFTPADKFYGEFVGLLALMS